MFIFIYNIFKIYLYRMYIECTNGHLGREIKASETITTLLTLWSFNDQDINTLQKCEESGKKVSSLFS